jgi:hypothetical protein
VLPRAAAVGVLLVAALWLGLPAAHALRAQPVGPQLAVGCTLDGSAPAFALLPTDGAPALQPPDLANAALDTGQPRLAVTCRAVVEDPDAADPFAPRPGVVAFTLAGPAVFVESGGATTTVACGCATSVSDDGSTVSAPPELTVHVAQQPGAPLPAGRLAQAITLSARFQPNDGSPGAAASALLDLAPPTLRLELGAQPLLDRNGSYATVLLTLNIAQLAPDGCVLIDGGPYESCAQPVSQNEAAGAEPGSASFSTTLGAFANDAQQLREDCGELPAGPPLTPLPGVEQPYPLSCEILTASVALRGHVGDASFGASFRGAYTGATASARISITVPPEPPSFRLPPGCTQVSAPLELPADAPVSLIAESVTPPAAVTAIWRPVGDGWQLGYERDLAAPLDFATVTPGEVLFVCVDVLAGYPLH